MMRFIRYKLAALCLAASVGCLLLWWRSQEFRDLVVTPYAIFPQRTHTIHSKDGLLEFSSFVHQGIIVTWSVESLPITEDPFTPDRSDDEWFGQRRSNVWFPIWYPALIFALAGVGILRIGRFTIRSALVGMTIVAVLLGMVVVL